jgi:hypothetical protein
LTGHLDNGFMQGGLHQDLLAKLGETVGIADLVFDQDGHVALSFDDVTLHIEHQAAANVLLVTAEVEPLPPAPDADWLGRALELNHARLLQRDGCIGIDRGAGRIVFIDRVPLHGMTQQLFEERLNAIIDGVETWRKWLKSPGRDTAENALAASATDQIFRP